VQLDNRFLGKPSKVLHALGRGDRPCDVRFWPKAFMPSCAAHVRFRGMVISFIQTRDRKGAIPMAQSGWYHDKAAQCNRMALLSTNAVTRNRLIRDRDNWMEIAARIDAAEEAIELRKTKK